MRIPATSQNQNDYKNQNLRKHCKPYRRSVDCSEMKRCKHDERIGERLAMIEEEEVKWHRFNSSNSMSFSPTSSCNQKSISKHLKRRLTPQFPSMVFLDVVLSSKDPSNHKSEPTKNVQNAYGVSMEPMSRSSDEVSNSHYSESAWPSKINK
jgi:hypothetical protein